MKKLSIVLLMALAMVFMAGPAFADFKFKFDFDNDQVWDDTWNIDPPLPGPAGTVEVKVYATDLSSLTYEFLAIDWRLIVDITKASAGNLVPNPALPVHSYYDVGDGSYEISNYYGGCPSGAPDTLLLLTFDLEATASGDHNLIAQNYANDYLYLHDCGAGLLLGIQSIATIHQNECENDGDCSNNSWCDGVESCISGQCVAGTPPCSDDGLFCNGSEICDEATDTCFSSGSPCTETECNHCQEVNDICFDPVGTGCSAGECDGSGNCLIDTDSDGVLDDGDGSGTAGDNPCVGGNTGNCDDNCPLHCNSDQLDADNDGIGDVCDPAPGCGGCGAECEQECSTTLDTDGDGIIDVEDNCPDNCNTEQLDADEDGIGDVCDPDPGCGGCVGTSCEQECII